MSNIIVAELAERDYNEYIKLLKELGWRISFENISEILKEYRDTKYTSVIIAKFDGKIVGRTILDTVFPPYSEIVNLAVHPRYRGMGVGTKIVLECIRRATEKGFNIVYLMCDARNIEIHRFYSKLNFTPVIIGRSSEYVWVYNFTEQSFVGKFVKQHPFIEKHTNKTKAKFHGQKLYTITYIDPLTRDMLKIFLKGQPGQPKNGTMPRIAAVKYNTKQLKAEIWITELTDEISRNKKAFFFLNIKNLSEKMLKVEVQPIKVDGVEICSEKSMKITVKPKEYEKIMYTVRLTKEFKIPIRLLSFQTITATLKLNIDNVEAVVSAGFSYR